MSDSASGLNDQQAVISAAVILKKTGVKSVSVEQ